jgi:CDGSH iron-sulfur domain-containing protein 3
MPVKPRMAGNQPILVEVEQGKTYWWCACGQSKNQPFCDGSHKGGSFEPKGWKAEKSGKVYFCACKQTGKSPLCDGTHNGL